MNYKHSNGKTYRIPDAELENNMKFLKISLPEAIKVWLEDNGHEINAEQEALTKKAKDNKITATIHQAKREYTKKTQRERCKKEDLTKEGLIKAIAEALPEMGAANVIIENAGKIITFTMGADNFKIDLIRQRKKKEEGAKP